jgi:hypothetical protein
VASSRPSDLRTPAACAGVATSSADPGAFSMRTVLAPGSIAFTASSSEGQMTITTREWRIMKRSMARNARLMRRERLNAKFVSCCGRLECMS